MKKFFALLMVMLVLISLTACGGAPITDKSGNELKNGAVVFDKDVELTVSKTYMSDSKYGESFYALLENDEYKLFVETNVKIFVEYPENSTIKGHLVVKYDKSEKGLDGAFTFDEFTLWDMYCAEK